MKRSPYFVRPAGCGQLAIRSVRMDMRKIKSSFRIAVVTIRAQSTISSVADLLNACPANRLTNKLCLLVAYLQQRGPTCRQKLATLLWPNAANPQNCLRVALSHLRREGLAVHTNGDLISVTTHDPIDHDLRYADLSSVSCDFESWVLEQREQAAAEAQQALLGAAAMASDPYPLLWQAWYIPDAPLPSATTLARFLNLCPAGTALHATLSAELTELTGGWMTQLTQPLEQAVFASWLDGGITWLNGDVARLLGAVARVQDVLIADGQVVLQLPLDPSFESTLTQALATRDPRALTVFVTPGHGVSDTELQSTLAAWPDLRFIIVGCAAPAAAGQTLGVLESRRDTEMNDAVTQLTAAVAGRPDFCVNAWPSEIKLLALCDRHLPCTSQQRYPPRSRGDPSGCTATSLFFPPPVKRIRPGLRVAHWPDARLYTLSLMLPRHPPRSTESFPAQLRIRTT